ncbi:MAG: NUDIX domain-containing protein [Defluviitaleaceae bacterium]|nr:NUDIX domain-containing protein [Defluviitaleaceae bacterium]
MVHVWKHNGRGEWLIDKRANRGQNIDGMWETTGGCAVAGDDSLTAALRETKEELGIDLDPQKGELFERTINAGSSMGGGWICDVWIFLHDCQIEDVRFSDGETCAAMWASAETIKQMMKDGIFLDERFYPYFEQMINKHKRRTGT